MSYKFVLITDEYIDYLKKTEPRVMSNKAGERVYMKQRKYWGCNYTLCLFTWYLKKIFLPHKSNSFEWPQF